jgi:hypothetical protein
MLELCTGYFPPRRPPSAITAQYNGIFDRRGHVRVHLLISMPFRTLPVHQGPVSIFLTGYGLLLCLIAKKLVRIWVDFFPLEKL